MLKSCSQKSGYSLILSTRKATLLFQSFSGGIFILWQDNGEVSTHFFHIVFGLGSLQYGMVVAVVPEHGLNGMHEVTNSASTSAACSVLHPAVCLLRCYIARGKESMHSDTCRAVELSTFYDL